MELYNLIADWTGWPVIVAIIIIAGTYGYWILQNRIDGLKENNEYLLIKLDESKRQSPDILFSYLVSRHKILIEELEKLYTDENKNKQAIAQKEVELSDVKNQLLKLKRDLDHVHERIFATTQVEETQPDPESPAKHITIKINTFYYTLEFTGQKYIPVIRAVSSGEIKYGSPCPGQPEQYIYDPNTDVWNYRSPDISDRINELG